MKQWTKGAPYGALKVEVVNGEGRCIATVFVKQFAKGTGKPEVWPEGEANLAKILAVPDLLEALRDQCRYLEYIGESPSEKALELLAELEED